LLDLEAGHLLDERSGEAALRRVVNVAGAGQRARAQAQLRDEHACAREQAHLEQVAPVESCRDQFAPVSGGDD
jgi:hypothetical protein